MIRRGLEFSAVPGFEPTLLDLYTPDGVTRSPIVVWIHGGGFHSGDRVGLPGTLSPGSIFGALTAAGFACASIDYRLAPAAHPADQVADVRAAVDFLVQRAPRYGYDPERLGVWGESAGGLHALLAGFTIPRVKAVVAWYPIADLAEFLPTDPVELERQSALYGVPLKDARELAVAASPITHVAETAPPVLLVHGDEDAEVPVAQSLRLHERLLDVGADSTLRIVSGADHCFMGYPDVAGLLKESVDYLGSRLTR
ncbi:MAG TPA: prolyl oligopeptidase family serine peptidase [Actinospica sp.]|nr:prolyl oligopeptidase family serine peptidase [Actinospica sp.]